MVCKVYFWDAIIEEIFQMSISLPENSIAPSWHPLLLTCIIVLSPQVKFIGWHELYRPLLKLSKKHVVKFTLCAFIDGECMLVKCQNQIILV